MRCRAAKPGSACPGANGAQLAQALEHVAHWIVIDEAHHVLPEESRRSGLTLSQDLTNIVMITVDPGEVLRSALGLVDMVFTVGQDPQSAIAAFAKAAKLDMPKMPSSPINRGEALVWEPGKKSVRRFAIAPSSFEHHRHRRKYATGDVGEEQSFYFRGPRGELNLQAQNLIEFLRLGKGVDADTWNFHLKRGDYSGWFRGVIKDEELADRTAAIERRKNLSAAESLKRIEDLIADTYTLPEQSGAGGVRT